MVVFNQIALIKPRIVNRSGGCQMQEVPKNIFQDIVRRKVKKYVITFRILFSSAEKKVYSTDVEIAIFKCLRELHGQAGTAYEPTLIAFDRKEQKGDIEISGDGLVKLWSALTLANRIGDDYCAFRIASIKACQTNE